MKIVSASVALSLAQIVLLLILVRVLGSAAYANFSIIFSIAIAIAALASEWLRLVVARFSSIRGDRVRSSILRTAFLWSVSLSALSLMLTLTGMGIAVIAEKPSISASIAAVGSLTCAAILGECTATFLRFNRDVDDYLRFLATRIAASGLLMLAAATTFTSAAGAAIGFALGSLLVSTISTCRHWLPLEGRIAHRRLLRLFPIGAAMAASSILTSATLSLLRVALRPILPATEAGAIFLALDLATRGMTVLGGAFNTWSAKLVFQESHARTTDMRNSAALRIARLFALVWATLGAGGALAAYLVPILVTSKEAYGSVGWIAAANLSALLLLMARIYSLDLLLSAMRRYRTIVVASISTIACMPIAWLEPALAAVALPLGATLSVAIVLASGWKSAVVRTASLQAIGATLIGAIVLWSASVTIDAWSLS